MYKTPDNVIDIFIGFLQSSRQKGNKKALGYYPLQSRLVFQFNDIERVNSKNLLVLLSNLRLDIVKEKKIYSFDGFVYSGRNGTNKLFVWL